MPPRIDSTRSRPNAGVARLSRASFLVALMAALVLSGCRSDGGNPPPPPQAQPDVLRAGNSDISVGPNRMVFSVKDTAGQPFGSPDIPAGFALYEADDTSGRPITETSGQFLPLADARGGFYTTELKIPHAGYFDIEMKTTTPGGQQVAIRTRIDAAQTPQTPAIGAAAPSSATKTTADASGDLKNISTDEKPDPALYQLSIKDAIASGKTTVVAFATPARCVSRMCGPTLDVVKAVRPDFPGVNFIHVEVFDKPQDLANDTTVPAVDEWKLPTEPWVFVINADGKITAKFEGAIDKRELAAAIAAANVSR